MNGPSIALGLLLLLDSSATVAAKPACVPSIDRAWVRAAPPGATTLAAYATVRNSCSHAFAITGVDAPGFAMTMIHATVVSNGISTMRDTPSLSVPAHGQLLFAPGGRHLMLMNPDRVLRPSDKLHVALLLSDGRRITADFPIRKDAPR